MRTWLVERDYDDKGLVRLVYATPDGDRAITVERSAARLAETTVTAARDVEAAKLRPVSDASTRERYREEVERLRERHDPDDEV